MTLPSEAEINPFGDDDLDGAFAAQNLLGKSVQEAAALLAENSMHYQEDYQWMGPVAFCFYVRALLLYLESDESSEDYDFAYAVIQLFRTRLTNDRADVAPAIPIMREFCSTTSAHFTRLGFPEKYRLRLPRRIAELEATIEELDLDGPAQRPS